MRIHLDENGVQSLSISSFTIALNCFYAESMNDNVSS